MKSITFVAFLGIAVLSACSSSKTKPDDSESAASHGGPFTGAIFTTTENGSVVNENHYSDCRLVYLNGGPKGGGPGLPPGDYYFMVTDPSGKTMLSSDSISQRMVTVGASGEFETYRGSHDTGTDVDDGSLTVQLWPFAETPNPGGVYKAWLTPVNQYSPGEGVHGFIHRWTKTDNFKCERAAPPPPPPPPDAGPPPDGGEEPCEGEDCVDEDDDIR